MKECRECSNCVVFETKTKVLKVGKTELWECRYYCHNGNRYQEIEAEGTCAKWERYERDNR